MPDVAGALAPASRATTSMLVVGACLALAAQLYLGVRPGMRMPAGDFANYYTAARVGMSGEDLTPAYTDFLWFQQRIDAAGFTAQLGGFAPQPPAAALVAMPLTYASPLHAKQIWTVLNVVAAVATIVLLGQLAGTGPLVATIALLGTGVALANDLALGQFYLPLLLCIGGGLLLVDRARPLAGGLVLGLLLPIKPFAVPLLIYFAIQRQWRVVAGAVISVAAVAGGSIALLGWRVHAEYLHIVLPAQAAGMLQDPFHPLWQSWESLTRRMFVLEPTLNPSPVADLPGVQAFVTAVAVCGIWAAVVLLVRAAPDRRHLHYAAIVIATLAAAPGGASYHLVLLALPLALLAGELSWTRDRGLAIAGVIVATLLALPLPSLARRFDGGLSTPLAYPRLWLLMALLVVTFVALSRFVIALPSRRVMTVAAALVIGIASVAAMRARPHATDSARAVNVTATDLTGRDRGLFARPEMLAGELTFLAAVPTAGRYARFAADRAIGPDAIGEPQLSALSPDRKLLAFTRDDDIWLRTLATGSERRLTLDQAIDREPCWRDAHHVVFASDRGRGLGNTALYEIEVTE